MSVAKIAISMDDQLLTKLDQFIAQKKFKTRSQAIQMAVRETILRLDHECLIHACAQLDSTYEQTVADEGLEQDSNEWPEF